MTLYHFTSERHIHGVLEDGLTLGHIPLSVDPPRMRSGYQWLTSNRSFEQSWNVMQSLDYDRTAYRVTVEVPHLHRKKVLKWTEHCERLVGSEQAQIMNAKGDPDNWYLFKGKCRARWFAAVHAKLGFPELSVDAQTN